MADLKSMFANMSSSEEASDSARKTESAPKPSSKKQTIEKIYQKKTQLEHILLRPDTYIGSVESTNELMWIYDSENDQMVQKQIEYVPGLYKIYDEILVNAADNKQRDKKMDCIKIEIDQENNTISVYNNGKGIPVAWHQEENMYVPTMIFGHLLTSSNYNDEEEKVTGGRNGYGAKLCNIFSTKFIVETGSKENKKQFKQVWADNMSKTSDPKIKPLVGDEFTKITFCPDLKKFKMERLDDGIVGLMSRRAFDVAASTRGVKVFLNGKKVPIKAFKDYVDLYIKNKEDDVGNPLKIVYENVNERWEVALTLSEKNFQQMSFVNSIATTKGGRHVDYVAEMIVKQLIEQIKKKNKGGINIKPHQVKNHMWIFINCLITNPTFDSQTKETMTLQAKNFGSKCNLSEKFITQVSKSGIIESVLTWAKFKAQNELNKKTSGKKLAKLKGIPKLEDANEAGTKNALRCTLILTEGDSAKSLAVSGLGVIGRDYYGVFPLRGKLLNVREATHKQILENAEINHLIKILGLQYKKKYNTDEDMKTLRYGKVMIMTDQDQDGSHIKGLLINFIHYNWPELLRKQFLEEFITPIVKVKKRDTEFSFYSLPEFEEWKSNTPNHRTYSVKYYKGLGTSTSKEAKEYFTNMARHRIKFRYQGQQDDDHILLAFSKKHIEHRKEWLTNFMVESRRRKEFGLPEKYLYAKDTKFVSYTDFVNLELVLFSNADNVRSIPCLVDGLKPGQRKVLFTCIKRNDKREVKVAQLAGSVAEHSAYHHGEVSLCMTIVNLAQNFVGSNNINLLEPRGQFGTRLSGGKDSASPRYIFTKMSPLTRMLFHPDDDNLLKHEYDDNQKIEPVWYIPIIPMVLVNGAEGIGTGWMTKIPNYNPREIIENLKALLNNEDVTHMIPWYKNFKGTIEDCGDNRCVISGEIAIIGANKLEITELPVGVWTQNYKENVLEPLLHGSEKVKAVLADYKEYNTDTTVRFVVTCLPGQLENMEKEGLHKTFKLQTITTTNSMCVFDELGVLRRFESVMNILQEYFNVRLEMYQKRKDYLEGMLEAEASKLSNQARFIMEKCSNKIVVENKKRKVIVEELIKKGYNADPVKAWKEQLKSEEDEDDARPAEDDEGTQDEEDTTKNQEKDFNNLADVKKFDYLLGMSMWMLTDERKNELLRQRDNKLSELEALKLKTKQDLWKEDLDALLIKLDQVERKERDEEAGIKSKDKKVGGKKKLNHQETMPSPMSKRVVPIIGEDLKKKIQTAVKSKEKAKKGVKKENIVEEIDEFDLMVKSKKTLKDKLGTPEEIEKKIVSKKGDGMKQTKLNFKKKAPDAKANGSPKKRGKKRVNSDSEEEEEIDSESDIDFVSVTATPVKERTKRTIKKPTKYFDDDDDSDSLKSNSDIELFENKDLTSDGIGSQEKLQISSDSENDSPPPKVHETSDSMFDLLIGKKNNDEVPKERPVSPLICDTDSVSPPTKEEKKKEKVAQKRKREPKKKQMHSDSDSDAFAPKKNKKNSKKKDFDFSDEESKKRTISKKKGAKLESSDSDFDIVSSKLSKKINRDSSEDEFQVDSDSNSNLNKDLNPPKTNRGGGRVRKQANYVFDDDSD